MPRPRRLGAVRRSVGLPALGAAVLAAALVTAFAPSASASAARTPVPSHATSRAAADADAVPFLKVLWDQHDYDATVALVSQDFEPVFDGYDAQGADDFVVKGGWLVTDLMFPGETWSGSGPVESATVTLYHYDNGYPGSVVATRTIANTSQFPDQIILLHIGRKHAISLPTGKYWVSVQADLDFENGGIWGWRTMEPKYHHTAEWKNPDQGWAKGCPTYTNVHTCFDSGEGSDFQFTIWGLR